MTAWQPLGDRAIRFARPRVAPHAIVDAVRAWPGVVDVVVAAHDIAAYFEREPAIDPTWIASLDALPIHDTRGRDVELRCVYDGEDLAEVARACNLDVADVVARHAAATYTVETIGFAPGFAYLAGLDARLELPRRATPRPRVPAGSIGIAGPHTAVYPFDSPGGWHLIGRVIDAPMFTAAGPRLAYGDRVRFVR
jgi:KipI family sensor histidine kinase inhibitor